MVTLILLLRNASSLALEQPGSMVRMSGRRLLIFLTSQRHLRRPRLEQEREPAARLAHGTGTVLTPCTGQAEARAHLETDRDVRLLPAVPCIPEIHGLDLPLRLQLQGGGEQVRGIHALNLPDRYHQTDPPPTTNSERPLFS